MYRGLLELAMLLGLLGLAWLFGLVWARELVTKMNKSLLVCHVCHTIHKQPKTTNAVRIVVRHRGAQGREFEPSSPVADKFFTICFEFWL